MRLHGTFDGTVTNGARDPLTVALLGGGMICHDVILGKKPVGRETRPKDGALYAKPGPCQDADSEENEAKGRSAELRGHDLDFAVVSFDDPLGDGEP
ncbi:hypothetical protein BH09MYX1_BH09MYX1_61270 [soil metagenome]